MISLVDKLVFGQGKEAEAGGGLAAHDTWLEAESHANRKTLAPSRR